MTSKINIRLPSAAAIDAAVRMAKKIDALQKQLGVPLTVVGAAPIAPWQKAAFEAAAARMRRLCPFPASEIQP